LPYQLGGQAIQTAGTYVQTFPAVNGCDSVVTLTLSIDPTISTSIAASTCNPAQVGVDTLFFLTVNGCDSLVITTTTLTAPNQTNLTANTCDPAQAGIDTVILTNQAGCDSLVISQTSLSQSDTTHLAADICDNESFNFQGQILTQLGTYSQLLTNSSGCDSLLILDLAVFPTYDENLMITIHAGDSYVFDGRSFSSDTMVSATFSSREGCDSVVNLILQVQQGQQNLIPPSNLRSVDTTLLLYTFVWQDNSGDEDGFIIYRNGLIFASTAANDTVFTDTILTFGQSFDYRVAAFRGNDTSSQTNAISYFLPSTVHRLELSYICHEADSNLLFWNVYNPARYPLSLTWKFRIYHPGKSSGYFYLWG